MTKPKRHSNHIIDTKAKKYLENQLPDEWVCNTPATDYGLDYQVEICLNNQVTGLNFSIQLKGHEKGYHQRYAKAVLKHSTISYYKVRLEPIMIVVYEDDTRQAYWAWLNDLDIDLTKGYKEYVIKVPKTNILGALDWSGVVSHVQTVFNNRTFISDLDISRIHNDVELAAWKVYHDGNYEQAVYLFRELIDAGTNRSSIYQALSWSLFQCARYPEALLLINELIGQHSNENLLQIKACILAEYGISQGDRGQIIQARDLFKRSLSQDASNLIHYNYANTLGALGDYPEAVRQYQVSLKKDSYFAQCWKNLGTAQGQLGDHQEEIRSYEAALSIDPQLTEALFSMGIALTKDFKKYEAALVYFKRALEDKSRVRSAYISGFYWVAEAFKQTGDLKSALYWADYGLNFEGNNRFLLDFKTELLAAYWPDDPEIRSQAEDFFNYRLELSHDGLSLFHLITLKNWSLEEAYPLLQLHSPLFRHLPLNNLLELGFDLDMVKATLLNMQVLALYKNEHKVTRFMDHLISGFYSIGPGFYELLDIVSAYAFNHYISCYQETHSEITPSKNAFEILEDLVPKLVPFLVDTDQRFETAEFDMVVYTLYNGLRTVVYREIGALTGFLNHRLGIRKVDPAEYISEEMDVLLTYNLLVAINTFLERYKAH